MTFRKDIWKLSKSSLDVIYPDYKKSVVPLDILIFVNIFLCKIHMKYYDNGKLKSYDTFVMGKLHEVCKKWYNNGRVMSHGTYINGRLHGEYKEWGSNCNFLVIHYKYINGIKHGVCKKWCL